MANEKRLIDANALTIPRYTDNTKDEFVQGYRNGKVDAILEVMTLAPTVDAVEVVRCKGCRHWIHIGDGIGDCTNGRFHLNDCPDPVMNEEEFCCLGERKDNENK